MTLRLERICRYPVKGLSADPVEATTLSEGAGLAHDRRFAVAHGTSAAGPAPAGWQPKSAFFTLVRHERLARLACRYDAEANTLAILRDGRQVVKGRLGEPSGRIIVEQFFRAFMSEEARGPVRLVDAPGVMFGDTPDPLVSLINLASVRDLERVTRVSLDPVRFRGNLYFDGGDAWAESAWPGRDLMVGPARLHVVEAIERCAATNVNPESAKRDINIPLALQSGFGHVRMGVYARVVEGGGIGVGDEIRLSPDTSPG